MSLQAQSRLRFDPMYPDSDGQPIADNTLQFRWIAHIEHAMEFLFRDRPDVFVAGDLLWYPVKGDPKTRAAPDVLIAFGPGKGDRGSYKQWEEEGIAPQVTFEVLSPGNTVPETAGKLEFYRRHGVEEYYVFDPDRGKLNGWIREGDRLAPIGEMNGWVSPLLQVRFELSGRDLILYGPDGERFQSYAEVQREVEEHREHAEYLRQIADEQREHAERQRQIADEQRERAERLAARLRDLGIDPD